MENSKFMIVVDSSYLIYYSLFSAVNKWLNDESTHFEASAVIKPASETDQSNLPNLLLYPSFKEILKKSVMNRFGMIDQILKSNYQEELDAAGTIHIVLAEDAPLQYSFRKKMFPEYKAQRRAIPKSYDIYRVKAYVGDVLFDELNLEKMMGITRVKINGAEGDDVIAVTLMNSTKERGYIKRVLFSSDHDFLQLENVEQWDLSGNRIVRESLLGKKKMEEMLKKGETVDAKTFLLTKILMGDVTDNIPHVKDKLGPIKSYKYACDKAALKQMLLEDQDAAKRFLMNKKLIDFNQMPAELSSMIYENVSKTIDENASAVQRQSYGNPFAQIDPAMMDMIEL